MEFFKEKSGRFLNRRNNLFFFLLEKGLQRRVRQEYTNYKIQNYWKLQNINYKIQSIQFDGQTATSTCMCCMSKLNESNGYSTQGYQANYFINAFINFSLVFLRANMELDIVYTPCPRYRTFKRTLLYLLQ